VLWRDHPLLGPADAMPTHFWGPEELDHQAWMELSSLAEQSHTVDMLLAALDGATRILDVGGGTGNVAQRVAERFGHVTVVEPSAAQYGRIRPRAGSEIDVRPGRGEALPVQDAEFDAVMATSVLQYTSDPFVSVAEMARASGDAAGARVVLVQAAPMNHMVELYNLTASVAGTPRAHHGWLLAGAIDVLELRGFTINLATVRASVRWPNPDAKVAASLLQRLHFAGHRRAEEMRSLLQDRLQAIFADSGGVLRDDGVMLVART
jgi:SAM-dependent methyltransferase